jgi:hypothetical protein
MTTTADKKQNHKMSVTRINLDVGLQMMISPHHTFLHSERFARTTSCSPDSQSYDASFKLTQQEIRQNEISSRRDSSCDWKKMSSNPISSNTTSLSQQDQYKQLNLECYGKGGGDVAGNIDYKKSGANPGLGFQMTSPRFKSGIASASNVPYYDVEFKLSDREKRQNEILSRRYMKGVAE